jgi:hypothetical protein
VDAKGDSTIGLAEISIAKNRNGAIKDIKLRFVAKYAKFIDYQDDFAYADNIPSGSSFDGTVRTRNVMSRMDEIDHDEGDANGISF